MGIGALVSRHGGVDGPSPGGVSGKSKSKAVAIATVKRNRFGTQPFDRGWLNLDFCGLICARLTYLLHAYGAYSFGWAPLSPWFSKMDKDGHRELRARGWGSFSLLIRSCQLLRRLGD